MTIKQFFSHACVLSAVFAAGACNSSTPTGALTIPFEIGAGIDCGALNVENVRVTLLTIGGTTAGEPVDDVTVACSTGEATFTTVPAGKYNVLAQGLAPDAEEIIVVDNFSSLDTVVEVLEGQDFRTNTIKMFPTPAKLQIRWSLGFQTCGSVPLDTLEVLTYKNGGTAPLLMGAFACDAPSDAGDYRTLPDPDRDLEGASFDTIEINPRDAMGNMIGDKLVYNLVNPPGAGRTVNLSFTIECTDATCTFVCPDTGCQPD